MVKVARMVDVSLHKEPDLRQLRAQPTCDRKKEVVQILACTFHFYLKYSTFCYLYSGQPGGTEATICDRHHCNWAVLTGWCYGVLETVNFSYLCFLLFADLHISYTERKSHSFEARIYVLFFLGHSVPGSTQHIVGAQNFLLMNVFT